MGRTVRSLRALTLIWLCAAGAPFALAEIVEEVQTHIRYETNDPRACIFGCVKNADGSFSPIHRVRRTQSNEMAPAVETVMVPNREVRYQTTGRHCGFNGCVKNADGSYSPKIWVPKTEADKYLIEPGTNVRVTGYRGRAGVAQDNVPVADQGDRRAQATEAARREAVGQQRRFATAQERKQHADEELRRQQVGQQQRFATAQDRAKHEEETRRLQEAQRQQAEIRDRQQKLDAGREAAAAKARADYDRKLVQDQLTGTPSYEEVTRRPPAGLTPPEKRFPGPNDNAAAELAAAEARLKAAQETHRRAQNMDDRVDAARDVEAAKRERDVAAENVRTADASRVRRDLATAEDKLKQAQETHRRAQNMDDRVDAARDVEAAKRERDALAARARTHTLTEGGRELTAAEAKLKAAEEAHRRAQNMDDRVDAARDVEAARKERDAVAARLTPEQTAQNRADLTAADAKLKAAEDAHRRAQNMDDRVDAARDIEAARKERDAVAARVSADETRQNTQDLSAADAKVKEAEERHRRAQNMDDRVDAARDIEAAKRERDAIAARTPRDDVHASTGTVGVAQPGSETTAAADPCANPKMSHRQAEDCSMKKYEAARKEADGAVARCFYSGFAARNGEKSAKCEPVRSTADAKKLGVNLKGVVDTNCGDGMVMCNPLVFGVQSDKRGICVRSTKNASKDCAQKANMSNEEAKKRYQELMKDPENQRQFKELQAKHKRTCDANATVTTGAYTMKQVDMDRAFTSNTKRQDLEDHRRTCEVLAHALNLAQGLQGTAPAADSTRSFQPAQVPAADAVQ